jgi:hypothetical protein
LPEVAHEFVDAGYLQISPENHPDPFGLVLDDGEVAVLQPIAEGEFIWDQSEADWEDGFAYLVLYKDREGHCLVPARYNEKNYALGRWVHYQRRYEDLMPADRRKRLEAIGFVWDVQHDRWEKGLHHLKIYRMREGNCRVPHSHVEDSFRLGKWVGHRRQQRHQLSIEKLEQLDALPQPTAGCCTAASPMTSSSRSKGGQGVASFRIRSCNCAAGGGQADEAVSCQAASGLAAIQPNVSSANAIIPRPRARRTPVKIALTTLGVALPSAIYVISNAVVGEITPAAQRGALLAIGTAVASSAGLLAPYIMGSVIESAATPLDGFNTGFFMCGVIMLVGGGIAMALVNPEREERRSRRLQPLTAST